MRYRRDGLVVGSDRRLRWPLRPRGGAAAILAVVLTWAAACGGADRLTLFVGPELAECVGLFPTLCMQVRESPDEPWSNFFGSIEGFTYEPGFLYELEVERHEVSPVPADASSYRYVLVRIVSRTPASTS